MTISDTERRARAELGDDVVDDVQVAARAGPVFTQAQIDFMVRAFGPLMRADGTPGQAASAA